MLGADEESVSCGSRCPKPHGVSGASDDEDDLPAHTTEEDIGDQGPSDFEFRNPDQPDQLFEQDEGALELF